MSTGKTNRKKQSIIDIEEYMKDKKLTAKGINEIKKMEREMYGREIAMAFSAKEWSLVDEYLDDVLEILKECLPFVEANERAFIQALGKKLPDNIDATAIEISEHYKKAKKLIKRIKRLI